MSGPDDRFDAPPDPVVDELRDEVSTLRTLLSVSLICLIVLTMSLDRYLLKQISIENTNKSNAQQLQGQLNATFSFSRATQFWNGLVTYSKSHPDFVPIINRFAPGLPQTVLNEDTNAAKH